MRIEPPGEEYDEALQPALFETPRAWPRSEYSEATDEQRVAEAAWAGDEATIAARFATFHLENPGVYRMLVRFARELKSRGFEHSGIRLIWERMRWEVAITTHDPATPTLKLNDHYVSRYARLIMEQEDDLKGFFATRELRAE